MFSVLEAAVSRSGFRRVDRVDYVVDSVFTARIYSCPIPTDFRICSNVSHYMPIEHVPSTMFLFNIRLFPNRMYAEQMQRLEADSLLSFSCSLHQELGSLLIDWRENAKIGPGNALDKTTTYACGSF